jgi:hypothetical protein
MYQDTYPVVPLKISIIVPRDIAMELISKRKLNLITQPRLVGKLGVILIKVKAWG